MNPEQKNKVLRWAHQLQLLYFVLIFSTIGLLLLPTKRVAAQSTVISGQVVDSASGDAIPFANIIITNSRQGTLTDISGYYKLEVKNPKTDSITALSDFNSVGPVPYPEKIFLVQYCLKLE